MKQASAERPYMDGLNVTMPCVFVRVDEVKPSSGEPPGCCRVPDLVQPPGFCARTTDLVVMHAGYLVFDFLCENMDFIPAGQLLNQGGRVMLGTTEPFPKMPVEDSNAQLTWRGLCADHR